MVTRRVDFALFVVEALTNDELVHEAPAIVGRQTPSALAHATSVNASMPQRSGMSLEQRVRRLRSRPRRRSPC